MRPVCLRPLVYPDEDTWSNADVCSDQAICYRTAEDKFSMESDNGDLPHSLPVFLHSSPDLVQLLLEVERKPPIPTGHPAAIHWTGYFTLSYLVHVCAAFVHASEWNPHAMEALRRNRELNGMQDQCQIHQEDIRQDYTSQPLFLGVTCQLGSVIYRNLPIPHNSQLSCRLADSLEEAAAD
ncbi:tRNA wybutosine-synthesizing protein 2 like protein [Chelonia mydas]|uniref:tRNA wybutosine-synthesizing protein 2 like protein n=1 Tax=Chelonia mydas TaxID=8469 RepID=M7BIW8_CHEMY|nr:tRNA wybutosine-synthesizing protein 2 like protein [Chelonia mydas]